MRRVAAAPDAFFQLPEVGMGLVPGAGGTVSLPRRIGRQRTAEMALSGKRIDAETALATLDERGFMQITDRSKDVIKSGGEWISSIDLEHRTHWA